MTITESLKFKYYADASNVCIVNTTDTNQLTATILSLILTMKFVKTLPKRISEN